jgi:hypothetical protein
MPGPDVVRTRGQVAAPRPPVLDSIAHPDLFLVLFSAPPATADPAASQTDSPAVATASEATDDVDGWSPRPGERVLWTGRSARLPWRFATEQRFDIWGDLLITAVVLALTVETLAQGRWWPIPVVGAELSAVMLHRSLGRLVLRRIRFARSAYAVTDQRVVAVRKGRRTVVTDADHRALRPPLVLADGSVLFAESRQPSATMQWPPAAGDVRRFGRRLRTRPAAGGGPGGPPDFAGLADPWTAARIAVEARGAAWSRPLDHSR